MNQILMVGVTLKVGVKVVFTTISLQRKGIKEEEMMATTAALPCSLKTVRRRAKRKSMSDCHKRGMKCIFFLMKKQRVNGIHH